MKRNVRREFEIEGTAFSTVDYVMESCCECMCDCLLSQDGVYYCYPGIKHEDGDVVRVRDCVLLRSEETDVPFIAKIAALWEMQNGEKDGGMRERESASWDIRRREGWMGDDGFFVF